MLSLLLPPVCSTLSIVASVHAVDVPPIAAPAQVEHLAAIIHNALNLPQIVHSRGPTAGNSATSMDSCDNADVERVHSRRPRAWRCCSEPYFFGGQADRPTPS